MRDVYGPAGGPGRGRRGGRRGLMWAGIGVIVAGAGVGAALGSGVLAGNGSSPAPQVTVTTTAAAASPSASAPGAKPAPTGQPGGSSGPAPPAAGSLAAAKAVVRSKGYTPYPNTASHWAGPATLNVILGTATGSADGYNNWAFFFVNGRYIGTDTKSPSAGIRVAWTSATTIALTYPLYQPSDPLCCASAGTATVRYHWNGAQLVALDPIPPAAGSGPSRN
jgi:LppP/LprE lipoprotein